MAHSPFVIRQAFAAYLSKGLQEARQVRAVAMIEAKRLLINVAQLLMDAGADVNARVVRPGSHHLGGTPLHWCARQKDDCAEVIAVLLNNGGDPTLTDAFGKTALQYAETAGHARVAEALRSNSA